MANRVRREVPSDFDKFLQESDTSSDSDSGSNKKSRRNAANRRPASAAARSRKQPSAASAMTSEEISERIERLRLLRLSRSTAKSAPAGSDYAKRLDTGSLPFQDNILSSSDRQSDNDAETKSNHWIKPKTLQKPSDAQEPDLEPFAENEVASAAAPVDEIVEDVLVKRILPVEHAESQQPEQIQTILAHKESIENHFGLTELPKKNFDANLQALDTPSMLSSLSSLSLSAADKDVPAAADSEASAQLPETAAAQNAHVDAYEYASDSFEDPISLNLNTTEDDKKKFFESIRASVGDATFDYSALNRKLSDDVQVDPNGKSVAGLIDDDDDDDLLQIDPQNWLKSILEPTEPADSAAAASAPAATASEPNKESPPNPADEPTAPPASNHEVTPEIPTAAEKNAHTGFGDMVDTYSMSFDSVSDLQNQKMIQPDVDLASPSESNAVAAPDVATVISATALIAANAHESSSPDTSQPASVPQSPVAAKIVASIAPESTEKLLEPVDQKDAASSHDFVHLDDAKDPVQTPEQNHVAESTHLDISHILDPQPTTAMPGILPWNPPPAPDETDDEMAKRNTALSHAIMDQATHARTLSHQSDDVQDELENTHAQQVIQVDKDAQPLSTSSPTPTDVDVSSQKLSQLPELPRLPSQHQSTLPNSDQTTAKTTAMQNNSSRFGGEKYMTFSDFLDMNKDAHDNVDYADSHKPEMISLSKKSLKRSKSPKRKSTAATSQSGMHVATKHKQSSKTGLTPAPSKIPASKRPSSNVTTPDLTNARQQALKRTNARFAAQKHTENNVQSSKKIRSVSPKKRSESATRDASTVVIPHVSLQSKESSQHESSPRRVSWLNRSDQHNNANNQEAVSQNRPLSAHEPFENDNVASSHLVQATSSKNTEADGQSSKLLSPSIPPTPTSTPQEGQAWIQRTPSEIADLYTTIHNQRERIASLTTENTAKTTENDTLKEQIRFLERLLEEERATSQNTVFRAKTEPSISEQEAAALRKELNEQETLIRGYQNENEKLTAQVKALRKEIKEHEQRSFLKQEALVRENQALRAQFSGRKLNAIESGLNGISGASNGVVASGAISGISTIAAAGGAGDEALDRASIGDFSAAKARVKIEALETELAALRHSAASEEADLRGTIARLEAQLADAQTNLAALQGADPESLHKLEADFAATRERYNAYIVELESKIEWYMENQDALEEQQRVMQRQEETILELRTSLEKLERTADAVSVAGQTDNTAAKNARSSGPLRDIAQSKRLASDARRIRELEREVDALREEKQRQAAKTSLADMMRTTRPPITEAEHIRHLKQRVRKLEHDHDQAMDASQKNVLLMQDQMQRMRHDHEKRVHELEICLRDLQSRYDEARSALARTEADAAARERSLEKELAAARKAVSAASGTQKHENSNAVSAAAQETQQADSCVPVDAPLQIVDRDVALHRRVLELDALVEDQAKRIAQLLKDRQQLEAETVARIREKDAMIESYELRIVEMQQDFRHKVLAVDDHARLDEMHKLRLELEAARLELADVRNKLQISEGTRQVVHETTITILKQAQEEASKLALAQHERGLEVLRSELRRARGLAGADSDGLRKSILHEQDLIEERARLKQRISVLEEQLAKARQEHSEMKSAGGRTESVEAELRMLECEADRLRAQVAQLQAQNKSLAESLDAAKRGWPPQMRQLESLSECIRLLEASARRREEEIARILSESQTDLEAKLRSERAKFAEAMRSKDLEIATFRTELDGVLEGIRILKQRSTRR